MLSAHSLLASAVRISLRQAPLLTRAPLVFLMAVGALHAQTPNPVLYLKFDEGTGTTAAQAGNPSLTGPEPVEPATLQIDAAHPGAQVDPMFYGLMIEEINHALDGGLYGELIQNRVIKDDPATPVHWSLVQDGEGAGSIALDTTQPISGTALTTSLRLIVDHGQRVGAANDGFWGIPVQPFTTYRASFWAKAASGSPDR